MVMRRRRNQLPDITTQLHQLLQSVQDGTLVIKKRKKYSRHGSGNAKRGSDYIGVTRNGDNWQVLINYNLKKTYIGTFSTPQEAAVCYDFYSLALHGNRARLNYTYKHEVIGEMVESYFKENGLMIPSKFMHYVDQA